MKLFGAAIPYVGSEEFASDVNPKVSNVDESGNYIYIWDKVAEDLQFAYDNLPDIWASDKGRVNKWAAAAFLAKLRLYQSSPYNGTNGSSVIGRMPRLYWRLLSRMGRIIMARNSN